MSIENPAHLRGRDWFGQPRGLTVLFLTEMWEKFSYYGMRALLVYYMTKQLLIGQQNASLIYGLYTASVYFTPVIGGIVADRWLGAHRSVIIGGATMALGHFALASEPLFYVALGLIALGNGLYLPSLPAQIRGLYRKDDPRRGGAYNVYYVGVNLGAFLAPLVCGTLGEVYGWHYGFGAAGLGMVAGLVIYLVGSRHLPPSPPRGKQEIPQASGSGLPVKATFLLLGGIAATVVVFRGAYEQIGNTVALWADTGVDRAIGSLSIPMTWFQSLNALMVFVLTPILVAWWTRQARRGAEPAPLVKMSIGAAGVAASYLMLMAVIAGTGNAPVHWLWLALFVVLLTAGELFILPVGLGLFGRLAPAGHGATTIATWFCAAFGGNLLAGVLGTFWSKLDHASFFGLMAGVALCASALLLLFNRAARRAEGAAMAHDAGEVRAQA